MIINKLGSSCILADDETVTCEVMFISIISHDVAICLRSNDIIVLPLKYFILLLQNKRVIFKHDLFTSVSSATVMLCMYSMDEERSEWIKVPYYMYF